MTRRDRSRGRRGVFRLNSGSSPFGRYSTFRLNQPGGTFGSGRTAGGGAGAGGTLAHALLAPAQSVVGSLASVGPPPVTPSPAPAGPAPADVFYPPPTFDPQPVATPVPRPSLPPTFDPSILPRRPGSTIRIF